MNYTMNPQFSVNPLLTIVSGKVVKVIKNDNGDIKVISASRDAFYDPVTIDKTDVDEITSLKGGRRRRVRKTQRRKSTKRRHTRRYRRK